MRADAHNLLISKPSLSANAGNAKSQTTFHTARPQENRAFGNYPGRSFARAHENAATHRSKVT